MVRITSEMNVDGGKVGDAIYRIFEIHSDKNGLDGYGMYMDDAEVVVCWCEIDDQDGILYANKSVKIINEQVVHEHFTEFCHNKFPEVVFSEFKNVLLSES